MPVARPVSATPILEVVVDVLVYAIPVFLVLSALEAWAGRARISGYHRLNDSISNLACGAMDQIVNASVGVGFLAVYAAVHARAQLLAIPTSSIAGWVAVFLAHDLAYWCFHYASHRVNVLWATHIVHHQSEHFNFTVSLRQGTVATWVTYGFYLPLAVIGFPPQMFLVAHGAYQIFQFFVHTEMVGDLGPVERVVATPRLHAVHHGRDARCLDKNYGGFLIVWDKLFGTFEPAGARPSYGITQRIGAWSPVWANLHYFLFLARASRITPRWRDKLRVWLAPPEWRAPGVDYPMREAAYDACAPATRVRAVAAAFVLLAWASFFLIAAQRAVPWWAYAGLSLGVVGLWTALTAVLDRGAKSDG
jgi:alkylglycerol monooxygenase